MSSEPPTTTPSINPQPPSPPRRRYSVFISYRHADNQAEGRRWANWLHDALERYDVPSRLAGQRNSRGGTIPDTLFPVFRDEDELPAGADLSDTIRQALAGSDTLVVICSPRSVASRFVADEIRAFKEMGRFDRIFALIIGGQPNATDGPAPHEECLPEPLRFGLPDGAGGVDWSRRAEPICADARPDGDAPDEGFTSAAAYRAHLLAAGAAPAAARRRAKAYGARLSAARMKVIAGVLGVPLGELTRQDNRHRIARLRRLLAGAGSLAAVALVAAGVATAKQFEARRERDAANHATTQVEAMVNDVVYDLGGRLEPLGRRDLLRPVIAAGERYYDEMPAHHRSPATELNRGMMWLNSGDAHEASDAAGAADRAATAYGAAWTIFTALDRQAGGRDDRVRRALALSLERVADVDEDRDPAAALSAAREARRILEDLVARAPADDARLKADLGQACERLGDILEDSLPDLDAAAEAFARSAEVRGAVLAAAPDDPAARRDYGVSLARLGDVEVARGRWAAARDYYQKGLDVRRQLVERHRLNTRWQSEISRSHYSLGDVLAREGDLSGSLAAHRAGLEIRGVLAGFEPSNAKWRTDVARSRHRVGEVLALSGKPADALAALAPAELAARGLVAARTGDPRPEADLARVLTAKGAAARAAGDVASAEAALAEAARILDRLAGGPKGDRKAARPLAACRIEFARVHWDAGRPTEAIALLRKVVAAREGVAAKVAGNAELGAELAQAEGLLAVALADDPAARDESAALLARARDRFAALDVETCLSWEGRQWMADVLGVAAVARSSADIVASAPAVLPTTRPAAEVVRQTP